MKVRVGVVDSGINPDHPHVGGIAGGVNCHPDGDSTDFIDRIGHGTAVAGAIREKAPEAELYAVRIFERRLSANIETLLQGLEWCLDHAMNIVNVSVGTANPHHRDRLEDLVRRARERDIFVVSAASLLPGMIDGAIAVAADPECDRNRCRFQDGIFWAAPWPRPIPGVPPERNLKGVSFAIANCTGLLARSLESRTPVDAYEHLLQSTRLVR
ncbi:MAG: S8 family serine peptidase [Acidobacteriia bacterium]|nr:S8 family serine peptidase [Terriglobia bacterium]